MPICDSEPPVFDNRRDVCYGYRNTSSRVIGEALRPKTQSGNLNFEGALSERRGPEWTNGYGSPYSRRAFFIAHSFLPETKERGALCHWNFLSMKI